MDKMKFNYQIVFKDSENSRIIFAGETFLSPPALIKHCLTNLVNKSIQDFTVETFIYQPVNAESNGSKESTR